MSVPDLRALCKQRGLKRYSSLIKPALIACLRGGDDPLAAKAAEKVVAMPSDLAAMEARLGRMEALLQRIAERVGVGADFARQDDIAATVDVFG
jgi:hypothetical protein